MNHDVFISYSTYDKITADAICHVLEENKIKCWIAPRNIIAGTEYAQEIYDAINNAKVVVLIFSEVSQNSRFVTSEIDLAFNKGKSIIPYKIEKVEPNTAFNFYLLGGHWLDAYPKPGKEFKTLIMKVSKLLGKKIEKKDISIPDDKLNEGKNFLDKNWSIALFWPLFGHSFSFIYIGTRTNNNYWFLEGIFYSFSIIQFIMYYILFPLASESNQTSGIEFVISLFFIIPWLFAIVHGFVIRKEFSLRLNIVNMLKLDKNDYIKMVNYYKKRG